MKPVTRREAIETGAAASVLLASGLAAAGSAAAAAAEAGVPAGYRYGDAKLPTSPVTLEDFELLKQAVLFTDADVAYLRKAGEVLKPQIDEILDVWYGFVGSHPHLLYYFSNKQTGEADARYLARVRARFGKWIEDTTRAEYDQAWLDWQHEIGIRHHVSGKNKADQAPSVDQIHLRYMIAFIVPISATVKPFLGKAGDSPEEVEKMHAAWTKAVTLSTILWSYPYVREGQF